MCHTPTGLRRMITMGPDALAQTGYAGILFSATSPCPFRQLGHKCLRVLAESPEFIPLAGVSNLRLACNILLLLAFNIFIFSFMLSTSCTLF